MIIDNFDVVRPKIAFFPGKTNAPLPVYRNAVLPIPVAAQGLKPIRPEPHQIIPRLRRVENPETFRRPLLKRPELLVAVAFPGQPFRLFTLKILNHSSIFRDRPRLDTR
jgi:hypothetical protein